MICHACAASVLSSALQGYGGLQARVMRRLSTSAGTFDMFRSDAEIPKVAERHRFLLRLHLRRIDALAAALADFQRSDARTRERGRISDARCGCGC